MWLLVSVCVEAAQDHKFTIHYICQRVQITNPKCLYLRQNQELQSWCRQIGHWQPLSFLASLLKLKLKNNFSPARVHTTL